MVQQAIHKTTKVQRTQCWPCRTDQQSHKRIEQWFSHTHHTYSNNNNSNNNTVSCLFLFGWVVAFRVCSGWCMWRRCWRCSVCVCVCIWVALEMLRSSDLDWCNTCFRFIRICFYELLFSLLFLLSFFFCRIQWKFIYFSIFWCIIFCPFQILRSNFKHTRTIFQWILCRHIQKNAEPNDNNTIFFSFLTGNHNLQKYIHPY